MATTQHQTWVRRAGMYFTDLDGFTYRIRPGVGTVWVIARQEHGTNEWVTLPQSYSSAVRAKQAVRG